MNNKVYVRATVSMNDGSQIYRMGLFDKKKSLVDVVKYLSMGKYKIKEFKTIKA